MSNIVKLPIYRTVLMPDKLAASHFVAGKADEMDKWLTKTGFTKGKALWYVLGNYRNGEFIPLKDSPDEAADVVEMWAAMKVIGDDLVIAVCEESF